jgi:hypothetical protein
MASWKRCTYVDGSSLTVQRPDHIRSAHDLPLTHLDHSADVAKERLEEQLQVKACLFVDIGGDTLDAAAARKTADGGLGDALDVVMEDFSESGGNVS